MSEAVHILAIVTVAADKASTIENAICRCAAFSVKEEACKRYEISRDLEKAGRFTVSEIWVSQAGFETHLASSHFSALVEQVKTYDAQLDVIKTQPLEPKK